MAKPGTRTRKKVKKQVADGLAHIHASFNNTIVTLTDRQGNIFNITDLKGKKALIVTWSSW